MKTTGKKEAALKHFIDATDKSRNERQKSMLLSEQARLSSEVAALLVKDGHSLVAQSARLHEAAVKHLRKYQGRQKSS